jgi:hypothetical protein
MRYVVFEDALKSSIHQPDISKTTECFMRYILRVLLVLATASCANQPVPAPVSAKTQAAGPVIARIASRKTTVVVRAGVTEPTYSLETAGGEVLVKDMTLGELARENLKLHDRVQNMQAAVMWAGD